MIIDCIADLHGNYPKLEGGDLLIVAGDLTARDTDVEYFEVFHWISKQKYKKKIVIAGNHDNRISNHINFPDHFEYLCDSGTEFTYYPLLEPGVEEKVYERKIFKIWGSPWTKTFKGMNPKCKAFTCETEEELASKFSLIPEDTDILVTHGPPYLIKDEIESLGPGKEHVGSKSLGKKLKDLKVKVHVFGHIHEEYGIEKLQRQKDNYEFIFINCSHVNEHYQPVNKPIRVIL